MWYIKLVAYFENWKLWSRDSLWFNDPKRDCKLAPARRKLVFHQPHTNQFWKHIWHMLTGDISSFKIYHTPPQYPCYTPVFHSTMSALKQPLNFTQFVSNSRCLALSPPSPFHWTWQMHRATGVEKNALHRCMRPHPDFQSKWSPGRWEVFWLGVFLNDFVNCTYFSNFLRFAPLGKIQNWILYLWFNCVVNVGEQLQLCYYRVCAVSSFPIYQLSTTWILYLPILIYHPKEWLSTGRTIL